jgi:predicted  nucleic acid-binding Zn-ribbon protein
MEREGWHISKHDQLRELCVLAATADVPFAEWEELKLHLNECQSCRLLFRELRDFYAVELSHLPSFATSRSAEQEDQLKDSILRAARAEGFSGREATKALLEDKNPKTQVTPQSIGLRTWPLVASFGLLAACLALALALGLRHDLNREDPARTNKVAAAPVPVLNERVRIEPNSEDGGLKAKLARLEADRLKLEQLLLESRNHESALEMSNVEEQRNVAKLSSELEIVRNEEMEASRRLEQLNSERQNDQVAIAAQNREIRSLNDRLENQTSTEDRNRNVVEAESNLRELVGARNLHIVDVYDTDSKGKTKKAVGRVFYTEGKSLVFYAYDLSDGHDDAAKYAYYVWGNKDGSVDTVRNLGTLGADDQQQKRWKLQVTDAAVLEDIDRVFVTVEPVGKLGPRPSGKRILTAYLGGPVNHP